MACAVRAEQSYQRLDVGLHRVVIATQVSQQAQARHPDVIIMRLAVGRHRERKQYMFSFNPIKAGLLFLLLYSIQRRFEHHFTGVTGPTCLS